jgi:hypothetical protein
MERLRNTIRVGEKRYKEPSSYATSGQQRTNNTGPPTNPGGGTQNKSGGLSQTQTKSGGGNTNNTAQSLHHSFSNLSINNSSKGLSLWSPKDGSAVVVSAGTSYRERADSDCSRESETSALDRFLTKHYESSVVKLSAKVSEKNGNIEFIITLTVKDFGSKEWYVIRTVADIQRFCDAVRIAGAGYNFPMPPPAEEIMQKITKAPPPAISTGHGNLSSAASLAPHAGQFSDDGTSVPASTRDMSGDVVGSAAGSTTSRRGSRFRHQKKKVNSGGASKVATSSTSGRSSITAGIFRAVSARLSLGNRQSRKMTNERVYPSVQEWFDAALEVWQKRWHSKSDEDGISLAFENFLCDPTGKTSAPIDLLTAVDFVILVVASAPNQNPALLLNRKREALIAQAAMRLARDYPDCISIDALKTRVLSYAWDQFETSHPMNMRELIANPNLITISQEEYPFMQLQVVQQLPTPLQMDVSARVARMSLGEGAARAAAAAAAAIVQPPASQPQSSSSVNSGMAMMDGNGMKITYTWSRHPQLQSIKMNLAENFSVPPTPRSLDHFQDVWKGFSDIVLYRVEQKLKFDQLMEQAGGEN